MRGGFGQVAAFDLIVCAFVSDIVDFGWVGINPALHILEHGIIFPTLLPQFVAHVAVLIRDVVAIIMLC